ncbi:glutathione S-transferase family protein [Methylonatrum kenyense]|uniref:glutathione S-transferase family protein n=1 Tax=Methylonatrum kenyense TaxID=455253 RepID=UPI0020BDCE1C|nr:glutathione S-transferase family protein [Methylonatrum kenyense]MCK8516884.1 glutathione S-transferase family protein [Methylonatrum kenyense]
MAKYTLFGGAYSTYVRTVRMLMQEKGLDYELVPVNILTGEGQSEAHLRRHPFGKIPALEVDGVTLFETAAIVELLEAHQPTPARFPEDPVERARMRQWMNVIDNYLYPDVVGTLVWQRVVNPRMDQPCDEQAVRDGMPVVRKHFGLLNAALENAKWLAGDTISVADFYLAPIMAYVAMTPEAERLLADHPQVARWWEAFQQRESFIQTPFDGS